MPLLIHDTLQRRKVEFTPRPGRDQPITLYVCGPTVYGPAHIGNARPAVVFDVLARVLRRLHPDREVVYARNLTDVDDKINARAAAEGAPIRTITDRFTAVYHADMAALGVEPPTLEPRATEHVAAMQAQIAKLVRAGAAYAAEGHVLFRVASYAEYGSLSGRTLDDMIAGARVEVAPYKRDPADFVLWKPSKPGEPEWPSPWGAGRPGWHIECSAMIEEVLGLPVDIHGGGHDLIFPHHENEAAQGACANGGQALARHWMHNGFLTLGGDKMSKSAGEVLLVQDLVREVPGEAVRWALLSAHYRAPLDWSAELLAQSRASLDRLYGVLQDAGVAAGIPAISFWAGVPHYVSQPPSPKATLALLHGVEDILDVTLPLADLPEEARAWERGVDELAEQDAEVAEYVKTLEEAKDATDLPEASGDAIAREFERYLRRRGNRGEHGGR